MIPECIAREYGCSCQPGQCRSASVKLKSINEAWLITQAKRNAERTALTFLAVLASVGLVFATGYTLTKMERSYELQARI